MGRKKLAKEEAGSSGHWARLARHIQRREGRRKGVEPRSIEAILGNLWEIQLQLSIVPDDLDIVADDLDDDEATLLSDTEDSEGPPVAGIAEGPPVACIVPSASAKSSMSPRVTEPVTSISGSASSDGVGVSASVIGEVSGITRGSGKRMIGEVSGITRGSGKRKRTVCAQWSDTFGIELPQDSMMEKPYDDQYAKVIQVLDWISKRRGISLTHSVWRKNIEAFGEHVFLRIEFEDWKTECAQLSDEWKTSWHGALTPFILNIVLKNCIFSTEHVGAGGHSGLFHSNNKGLHYPFKYAYPSPISGIPIDDEYKISGVEGPLYHSLIEIRVNPMRRCKRGGKHLPWHVTANERIPHEIRLSAALFCIYKGDRSDRHMRSSPHIKMTHGVPIDLVNR